MVFVTIEVKPVLTGLLNGTQEFKDIRSFVHSTKGTMVVKINVRIRLSQVFPLFDYIFKCST